MTGEIQFAEVMEKDREELFALHKEALGPVVDQIYGWDDEVQRRFFDNKFDPAAAQWILAEEERVGLLHLRDGGDHLSIDNFEVSPQHQGRGLGTAVLRDIQNRALHRRIPIRLQVFRVNRAIELYKRLGFRKTGETMKHIRLQWTPPLDGEVLS